jgi:ankyrin repeat protein
MTRGGLLAYVDWGPQVVTALAAAGANVNLCNANGASPIFIASQKGHEKVKIK